MISGCCGNKRGFEGNKCPALVCDNFEEVPKEIVEKIFFSIPVTKQTDLGQVSKRWREVYVIYWRDLLRIFKPNYFHSLKRTLDNNAFEWIRRGKIAFLWSETVRNLESECQRLESEFLRLKRKCRSLGMKCELNEARAQDIIHLPLVSIGISIYSIYSISKFLA